MSEVKETNKINELDIKTHICIEFTKALLSKDLKEGTSNRVICLTAISMADELIKQLNQD